MSAVELAVKKVRNLSEVEARILLHWLADQQKRKKPHISPTPGKSRQRSVKPAMRRLMKWYDSIRGTTDWEIPRMPSDPVHRAVL